MQYSHQTRSAFYLLLVLCFASFAADASRAETLTFTGTRFSQNPPANPVGRCAPAFTVNINPSVGTSTGTSNFGTFTSTQSHCITPPLPASFNNGLFTWTFASGSTLTGTYTGAVTASGTPGVFGDTENYLVTGGTGLFTGATGNITGIGALTFPPNALPFANVNLSGTVTTTPEPATMLLLGTGLAGVAARLRKRLKIKSTKA
jgi:hypothetical protein